MVKQFFAILLPILVCGCDISAMKNEAANKTEFSILQSYEYEYREVSNDEPYMIFKNALGTSATVVAFPIKGKAKGYIVMLANAEGAPKDKFMPDVDFIVTQKAFAEVRAATPLSKEIEQFIASHVR